MTSFFVLRRVSFAGPMAYFERDRSDRIGRREEAPKCPACGGFVDMLPWLPPKHGRFGAGTATRKPGDLVFGTETPFVASSRFVDRWREDGLTGVDHWDPVQVKGHKDGQWFHAVLPAPSVRADFSQMEVRWKQGPTCELCQQGYKTRVAGICVDTGTWQRQDLFALLNVGGVHVVSSAFRDWAEANRFDNVELVPAADSGWDELQGELRRDADGNWIELRRRR